MRQRAADALGIIGDLRAVEPLINTLNNDLTIMRQRAADALNALGCKPDTYDQDELVPLENQEN
jgi:HEAT repeat protein